MKICYTKIVKEYVGKSDNGDAMYQNKLIPIKVEENKLSSSLAEEILEEKEAYFDSIANVSKKLTEEDKINIVEEAKQLRALYNYVKIKIGAKSDKRQNKNKYS